MSLNGAQHAGGSKLRDDRLYISANLSAACVERRCEPRRKVLGALRSAERFPEGDAGPPQANRIVVARTDDYHDARRRSG
jgi:hypothetical protein